MIVAYLEDFVEANPTVLGAGHAGPSTTGAESTHATTTTAESAHPATSQEVCKNFSMTGSFINGDGCGYRIDMSISPAASPRLAVDPIAIPSVPTVTSKAIPKMFALQNMAGQTGTRRSTPTVARNLQRVQISRRPSTPSFLRCSKDPTLNPSPRTNSPSV